MEAESNISTIAEISRERAKASSRQEHTRDDHASKSTSQPPTPQVDTQTFDWRWKGQETDPQGSESSRRWSKRGWSGSRSGESFSRKGYADEKRRLGSASAATPGSRLMEHKMQSGIATVSTSGLQQEQLDLIRKESAANGRLHVNHLEALIESLMHEHSWWIMIPH